MNIIGRTLSILLWPIMWFYSPLRLRTSVLLLHSNKILLVKHVIGSGKWNLPGGGIKLNETAEETAIREIKEELNLDIKNPQLLNEKFIITTKRGIITRHQFVRIDIKEVPKITPNHEIHEYEWFDLDSEFTEPEVIAAIQLL